MSRLSPRRMREVAIVLAVVLMTVMAVPAAASSHTNVALASVHNTDTDFNNAAELTNVSVNGSGESASVEINGTTFTDDFEDDPADSGVPDDWENVIAPDSQNVTTDRAFGGSQSYALTGDPSTVGNTRPSEQPYASAITENVSAALYQTSSSQIGIRLNEGGNRVMLVLMRNGDLQYFDGTDFQTISTVPDANEWVDVTIAEIDPGTDQATVFWETASSSGSSSITTADNEMTSGYDETLTRTFDGIGYVDSWMVGTPPDSGTYISQNHSVDNPINGFTNITVENVSVEVTWQEHDGSSWIDINSSTFTGTGNHTLKIDTATNSDLRVNVTFDRTGDDRFNRTGSRSIGELHDEGVTFENRAPELSDPQPTGGEFVNEQPIELSVNVSDADFDTAQADEVTVTFYDGNDNELGQDTLTANGTVSIEHPDPVGGENQWYAVAEDSYGGSDRSPDTGTHTFEAPGELEIRDEQTEELLGDVNATVEFFFERSTEPDLIVEREADNGTVDMTGLPPDENFVVSADAEGYFARRIFVDSLFDTQTIYLLDDQADAVSIEFILNDFSGRFDGDESILEVQRNINESWQTVEGDFFGAGGRFTATLAQDKRHRLIVTNTRTGETRNLGTFTPTIAQQVDIEIFEDDDILQVETPPSIQWDPDVAQLPARGGVDIDTIIRSGSLNFSSYSGDVKINGSTVASFSGSEPGGETFTETVNLTDRAGENVTITVDFELEDGQTGSEVNTFTIREHFDNDLALLPTLTAIKEAMDEDGDVSRFSMMVSFISTIMAIGYTARAASTEVAAGIGLLVLVGFVTVGWAPRAWLFVGGITALALMGVQRL